MSNVVNIIVQISPDITLPEEVVQVVQVFRLGQSQAELKHEIQTIQLQFIQNYNHGPSSPLYPTVPPYPYNAEILVQMKFGDAFDSFLTNDGPVADCRLHCLFRQTGAL